MAWSKSTRIIIMLGIDAVFLVLELGTGLAVGSLALMADAFHMLNDIISLAVGLWAVKAAQRNTTDQFSFGYLRAEILGAAFNAVFLIALCLSIVLEAITRLIDPPEISNPKLILAVGCLGLVSNLAGFVVLGGHGHAHGGEDDHDHDHEHGHEHVHDEVRAAEEGQSPTIRRNINEGSAGDVFPEALIAQASPRLYQSPRLDGSPRVYQSPHIDGTGEDGLGQGWTPTRHRRRSTGAHLSISGKSGDRSIHPQGMREGYIALSKPPAPDSESSGGEETAIGEEEAVSEAVNENSPLLLKSNKSYGHNHSHSSPRDSHSHHHDGTTAKDGKDSLHAEHHHSKAKKHRKGNSHGHNHADMGMNAMILHVIGDALGNVGVVASALIIMLTDWPGRFYADPAVSLFITLIILKSTIPLTKATAKILLQATPDYIVSDLESIKNDIHTIPGMIGCHQVHIWQLSDTELVASMHIQVAFPISEAGGEKYMKLAREVKECLHAYGIHKATIQPEFCLDENHDHLTTEIAGLDGVVAQRRCRMDSNECLLDCVANCKPGGCADGAVAKAAAGTTMSREGSSHNHGHDHDHAHEHSHEDHSH